MNPIYTDKDYLDAQFKSIRDEIALRFELHTEAHQAEKRRDIKLTGIGAGIGSVIGAACAAFVAFFYKPSQ